MEAVPGGVQTLTEGGPAWHTCSRGQLLMREELPPFTHLCLLQTLRSPSWNPPCPFSPPPWPTYLLPPETLLHFLLSSKRHILHDLAERPPMGALVTSPGRMIHPILCAKSVRLFCVLLEASVPLKWVLGPLVSVPASYIVHSSVTAPACILSRFNHV